MYVYAFSRIRHWYIDSRSIPLFDYLIVAFTMGLPIQLWVLSIQSGMVYLFRIEVLVSLPHDLVRVLRIYLVKDWFMFSALCCLFTFGFTYIPNSAIDFTAWSFLLELSFGVCFLWFSSRSNNQMKRIVREFLYKYKVHKVASQGI